jgi:hypothetical protein
MLGRLDQRIQIDAARVSGNLQRVDQILGAEVSVGSGRLARMFHTQPDQMHFTEGTEPSPQRARSPAHRGHRADKVLGSVTSVLTSVRSVTKGFLQKSVIDAG